MTFGKKRQLLRLFRATATNLRGSLNALGPRQRLELFVVTREQYEALEFGLAHVKMWVPGLDDDPLGYIPGKSRFMRQNFLYRRANEPRDHLLFKGIKVFFDDYL